MKAHLIKLLFHFFAKLPLRSNHAIAALLGRVLFYFPSRIKKVSEANINIAFAHLPLSEKQALLKQSLIAYCKTVTEVAPIWLWPNEKSLRFLTVSEKEIMQSAVKDNKGVIFLTPHIGCWEICGLYMGQQTPITSMYQQPKMKELDALTRMSREKTGATLVDTSRKGLMALIKALRAGESVAILPDQTPKDLKSGIFAPFYQRPALTMTLITNLVQKTGATIVFGWGRRLPGGQGYHLEFLKADDALYDPDPLVATTALNHQVERIIAMAPEQYQWAYKRYKKVPEGLDKVY